MATTEFNTTEFNIEFETKVFKLISDFLNTEKNKGFDDFGCWVRFERAIDAFYIDKRVSKPEVFDSLRKYIYPNETWGYVNQVNFIKALDTLPDNDIRMFALEMQTKLYNQSLQPITDFVPIKIADYLLNRITTSFQSHFV
jgi:hypothetical protein